MSTYFSPFGIDQIIVHFPCDKCSANVESEPILVPVPNYMAEKSRDSFVDNDGYAICPNCDKEFTIWVNSGFTGGYIEFDDFNGDEDDITIEEIPEQYPSDEFDAILANTKFYETYENSISHLSRLNNLDLHDEDLESILRKQIWVSIITSMETYLSDALINTVFSHESFKKSFVQNFEDFSKRKFVLTELYQIEDRIDTIIKDDLSNIIYHNLPKLNGIYKDVLDINFGDFETIQLAILKRHDIVHRNGMDKDGNVINITSEKIKELRISMDIFVSDIDEQLKQKVENAG